MRLKVRRWRVIVFGCAVFILVASLVLVVSREENEPVPSEQNLRPNPTQVSHKPIVQPEVPEKKAEQSIQGTVWYDQNHATPAAGAIVTARNCVPPNNSTQAVTDNKGRFTLQAYVASSYALLAEDYATGLVTANCPVVQVTAGQTVKDVDLVVEKGGSISGRVIGEDISYSPKKLSYIQKLGSLLKLTQNDLSTSKNQPLKGVELTLKSKGQIEFEASTVTNAQGFYLFDGVPASTYTVTPKRPEEAIVEDRQIVKSAELSYPDAMKVEGLDFLFSVGGLTITGHTMTDQGQPISGAEVIVETFFESEPGAGGAVVTGTTKVFTDESGNYRVNGLRTMSFENAQAFMSWGVVGVWHSVRAQKDGYETTAVSVPAITGDLIETADAVKFTAEQLGLQGNGERRPGKLPEVRGREISGVDFVLSAGAAVSGTLVDRQGNPVSNRGIYLEPSKRDASELHANSPYLSAQTDGAGRFSFEALPADTYVFYCYSLQPTNMPNRLNADNSPLTLSPGNKISDYTVVIEGEGDQGEIRGRVLDAVKKSPVTEFSVQVIEFKDLTSTSAAQKGGVVYSDKAKGEFAVQGMSPGRVVLRTDAGGYGPTMQEVEVQAGSATNVTVLMSRGGVIEGSVSFNGAPSNMAVVRVYTEEVDSQIEQVLTDENGYYQTKDLPTGGHTVVAEVALPGQTLKRRETKEVTVEVGAVSKADFLIEGTATLAGVFSFPSSYQGLVAVQETKWRNTPLAIDNWQAFERQVVAQVYLRESGQYTFQALPPGDFIVTGVSYTEPNKVTGEEAEIQEASYEVHLESGQSVTLDIDIP